jgi:hypothetical protein
VTSVLDSPGSFDYIMLDGQQSPGVCVISSGGEREYDIQDQAQPLTLGANTVQRQQKNIQVTYDFTLWTDADFVGRDAWIQMFGTGARAKPPRVYQLADLNMGWCTRVLVQKWGPQTPKAGGGPWKWSITLHEYVRAKPFGGPALPPDAQDAALAANAATIAAYHATLGDVVAGQGLAARAGK